MKQLKKYIKSNEGKIEKRQTKEKTDKKQLYFLNADKNVCDNILCNFSETFQI